MAAPDPDDRPGAKPEPPQPVPNKPVPRAQPLEPAKSIPKAQPLPPESPIADGTQAPGSFSGPPSAGGASKVPRAQPIPAQPATPRPTAPNPPSGEPGPSVPRAQPVGKRERSPAQAPPSPTGARPSPAGARPAARGAAAATRAARPVPVEGGTATTAVHEHEEEPEEELTTFALRNSPPWLVSAAFHMLVMIILGLILLPKLASNEIELETVWAESLGEQLEYDSFLAGSGEDEVEEPVFTLEEGPLVEDPFAAPPELTDLMPDGMTATSTIDATQIGMALDGRQEGSKKALLAAFGGTKTTEKAVLAGLRWLARNQRKDGSWSLQGPYQNGAINENRSAATAMALLAFQGAGSTHKRGKFQSNVAKGWAWLLEQQDPEGNFFHQGGFNHRYYTNGQCAIALCELYGMSEDEEFKAPAERAIKYLLESQSPAGGWRYAPQADSDVSVTGWVLMALQSARMAYLPVPEENLDEARRFLDNVALDDGKRYPYQRGKEASKVMTAEALLCRQYLGWPRNDPRLVGGIRYLTRPENLVNYKSPNVYYWYYATQACHHMEGEDWKKWNEVMRQEVPEHQVKSGREAGSWDPGRRDAGAPDGYQWHTPYTPHGGRLYVTCLSIYMLEVYYRHLPIYSKIYAHLHRM